MPTMGPRRSNCTPPHKQLPWMIVFISARPRHGVDDDVVEQIMRQGEEWIVPPHVPSPPQRVLDLCRVLAHQFRQDIVASTSIVRDGLVPARLRVRGEDLAARDLALATGHEPELEVIG